MRRGGVWVWMGCVALLLAGIWVRVELLEQPPRFDEARSYMSFAADGPVAVMTRYDAPNNHVFYNLLSWIVTAAAGANRVTIRLPALVAGVLTIALAGVFLQRRFGALAAMVGAGVLAFGSRHIEFSTQGRGYAITALCFLVGWASIDRLARDGGRPRWWSRAGVVAAFVIGFWAVPTMVFAAVPLVLWWMLWRWCHRREGAPDLRAAALEMVVCGLAVIVGGVLVYVPILSTEGMAALVDNRFVRALAWDDWVDRLPGFVASCWSFATRDAVGVATVALVVGSLLVGAWRRERSVSWTLGPLVAVSVMLLSVAQRNFPPARTLLFLSPLAAVIVAEGVSALGARLGGPRGERVERGLFLAAVCIVLLGLWGHDAGAVRRSDDGGGYPIADEVVELWQTAADPSENLVVGFNGKNPLWFIDTVEHDPVKIGVRSLSAGTWVVVQDRSDESVAANLRLEGLVLARRDAEPFRWAQWDGAEVYHLPPGTVRAKSHDWAAASSDGHHCHSPWFGDFTDFYYPWIEHAKLGYLFVEPAAKGEGVWMWDGRLNRWWWTSAEAFPAILLFWEEPEWVLWETATASPHRRFFVPSRDAWVDEQVLRSEDDRARSHPVRPRGMEVPPDALLDVGR